jgi:phosphohistidine swiveling domain-containing protein
MPLVFESKARTLSNIYDKLHMAKTLPVFYFCAKEYFNASNNGASFFQKPRDIFNCDFIAVRSSSKDEDSHTKSNAGAFLSLLNIDLLDTESVDKAVKTVFASYDGSDDDNEAFLQPMLRDVKLAGVAFSCDISTLAPYYVINYDESGKTDTITSGKQGNTRTYIQYKHCACQCCNQDINNVIKAVAELEILFDNKFIDVEFAVTLNSDVYILQVRPVARAGKEPPYLDLTEGLYKVYKKIEKLQQPHPNLLGKKAIFGVMPDWNPAEIIGVKPKKLALSLYKELITDNIWAYQRDNYGYRNLRSHPLLVSFLGVPFIDVRVDFNSFIPKNLENATAKKLVEYYIHKLYSTPGYHDKIEFKIVHSCFYLDLPQKLEELSGAGFSASEISAIEKSLLDITNNIIGYSGNSGVYKTDLAKIDMLLPRFDDIVNSNTAIIDKIYWIIEDCKRYGTLPFAGIARAAFVAVQFLKSFVNMGIITLREYDVYMNSLNTIAKRLANDLTELPKENFLKIWGHIRPGTYDITSPRYDEAFEHYFSAKPQKAKVEPPFIFSDRQLNQIDEQLKLNGLLVNAETLLAFIKEAVEGREYAKFIFTKPLSYALTLIGGFLSRFGISREDAAFLDIVLIKDMYSSLDYREVGAILQENIMFNKRLYEHTKIIRLPSLILEPENIYGFYVDEEEPNFVTLGRVKSDVALERDIAEGVPLAKKIVFIKSADPGYDFLFTKDIAALVTQFGGANSHMAIRCAELGLPAVIGAGEKLFAEWSAANTLEIDCANKQVKVLA